MSRRGFNLSVPHLQCVVAAALFAVALVLAVVPPPEGAASDAGPAPAGQEAPAPALEKPKARDPGVWTASFAPARSARAAALTSRC